MVTLLMARTFKTRVFARWASKVGLEDVALCKAAQEIRQGLLDADLGGSVVKKRVPLPGKGKRGSVRTLVATQKGPFCFFMEGFKKNEKDNISKAELKALQEYAALLLALPLDGLNRFVADGKMQEICHEDKGQTKPHS
jgi:hypothetical protein